MATSEATTNTILGALEGIEVRVRKMFGEYCLYCDEKPVAFICDDILYIKILPGNQTHATGLQQGPCYPGSKDYYIIPNDRIANDQDWLRQFIQATADLIPVKKKR